MQMKVGLFAIFVVLGIPALAQSPCGNTRGPVPFKEQGKWGYLTDKGVVISPRFDVAGPFGPEGAIACIGSRCGVIDKSGKFLAPTWERDSRPTPMWGYSEGLAVVENSGQWGYIDRTGRVVIPLQFKYAGNFEDGIAKVLLGDKYFFIDKTGTRVTSEFDGVFEFHEDLAAVMVGKSVGYIRRDGSFALPAQYHSASGIDFSEGVAAVRVDGKVGFMDKNGNVVIEPKYDDVYSFSDGLAPVESKNKWGYVDHEGNVVIPVKYEIGHMFSEGLASVRLDGKWGYLDNKGQYAIPPAFDSAMPFCGGVARVETFHEIEATTPTPRACRGKVLKGKHGLIDHSGNYVWRDAVEQTWPSRYCF
jgi:WG containing repeat